MSSYDQDVPAEQVFAQLAELRATRLPIPRSGRFSRGDVVNAFASAFELIGGVPRLALWANNNPTEFYKLFGKMLPSATQVELISAPRDESDLKRYSTAELYDILSEMRQRELDGEIVIESD